MKVALSGIRSCALAAAVAVVALPALGQQSKPMAPDPQTQQSQPQDQSTTGTPVSNQSAVQTFQGMISQSQDGYVLKDAAGTSYQLDDQSKAKDFNGQNVKVTGKLDASTHTIRVSSIAPAS